MCHSEFISGSGAEVALKAFKEQLLTDTVPNAIGISMKWVVLQSPPEQIKLFNISGIA